MASKRITQETFDAAVQENIEEFEMGVEEAVREAMEQFESQGKVVGSALALRGHSPQPDITGVLLTPSLPVSVNHPASP